MLVRARNCILLLKILQSWFVRLAVSVQAVNWKPKAISAWSYFKLTYVLLCSSLCYVLKWGNRFLELVTLSRKPYLAKTNVYLSWNLGFVYFCTSFRLVQIYYIFLSQTQCIHFNVDRTCRPDYGRVSSSWRRFSCLCGGVYRGLLEVAGITGVMGVGLWCPLTGEGRKNLILWLIYKLFCSYTVVHDINIEIFKIISKTNTNNY